VNFAPRVRGAHRIIIAVTGLMHDGEFILAPRQAVHCIHKNRLIGSAPWLPPVISRRNASPEFAAQSKKNSGRTGHPVTIAL